MLGKNLIQAAAVKAGAAGGLGIEELFQTWLYTGNGSTQTITNGIDLAGEGGMVWAKCRNIPQNHGLFDTIRGGTGRLFSNTTAADDGTGNLSFSSSGFSLTNGNGVTNSAGDTYTSWTFRKAPGFFDVVTFTAGSSTNRRVSHSLGSAPGMIIIKRTDGANNWAVYHRSLGRSSYIFLNQTSGVFTQSNIWGATDPTSTDFGIDETALCVNGGTYVAYLFAHDEQIFGEGGDQSVIKCGSFTCDASGNVGTVTLGWEPQYILAKRTDTTQNWYIWDTMRGWDLTDNRYLTPNLSNAENAFGASYFAPTSTGFRGTGNLFGANANVAYIAIRRGPMKTPTSGTEVFYPDAVNANAGTSRATGFPVDWQILRNGRNLAVGNFAVTRLTGVSTTDTDTSAPFLRTYDTSAESNSALTRYWDNSGYKTTAASALTNAWFLNFRRAPGFFDVVAYTGNGTDNRTISHNLGVTPELVIVKDRTYTAAWPVYAPSEVNAGQLNTNGEFNTVYYYAAGFTSSTFGVRSSINSGIGSGSANGNYIAYLFATLPGISKVFSFTGNGTSQTIDCGFAAGARFVLLKRTDSAGNWLVADTARGIVSGNDPLLYLNSTAAEITTLDWIDPHSSGFIVNQEATANANVGGATYIGLAIA